MSIANIESRDIKNKHHLKSIRDSGMVPAVIYGGGAEPIHISVPEREFTKKYLQGQLHSALLDLSVNEMTITVLVKDIQTHPVSDRLSHIDFQRTTDKPIKKTIYFEFINSAKCPGIKMGGTLKIARKWIKALCDPKSNINIIQVDLSKVTRGSKIAIKDITIPEGIKLPPKSASFVIAKIAGSKSQEKTEKDDEGAS